jgi:hypothetical protein
MRTGLAILAVIGVAMLVSVACAPPGEPGGERDVSDAPRVPAEENEPLAGDVADAAKPDELPAAEASPPAPPTDQDSEPAAGAPPVPTAPTRPPPAPTVPSTPEVAPEPVETPRVEPEAPPPAPVEPPPVPQPAAVPEPPAPAAPDVVVPDTPVRAAATKPGLTYVGADKCGMCHRIQITSWRETEHAKLATPLDCEGCHGPGSEYQSLKIMKDPDAARAAGLVKPDATFCAQCHVRGWDDAMLVKAHAHKSPAP